MAYGGAPQSSILPFVRERRVSGPPRHGRIHLADPVWAAPFLGFRYPLTVAAIAIPLFVLYCYPYADNGWIAAGIQSYLSRYARMVGLVISAFDPSVVVSGNQILGRIFSIRIVQTCDAMELNILLAAALAGFPMRLGRRIVTVLVSILSLTLINIIRLCVLYWMGVHAPAWFNRTHQTLAPLALVACALVIFLIATRRAGRGFLTSQAGATRC